MADGALAADTPLAERLTMLFAGSTFSVAARGRWSSPTGSRTELGAIAGALQAPAAAPPLTRRLDRFTQILGIVSFGLILAVIALQLGAGATLRETFIVPIALAVSVISEGLPVAVTIALSIATRRMARRNVIVRHLPAAQSPRALATAAVGMADACAAGAVGAPRHGG
ncbi:hypothetical protein [Aurantimonas sp. VKM B-3413]|uniref:P-type ATPase n=1 Tax=Aurantimonas sp. VKM B-3413 TaxID=2779401 RepID=UPI001E5990D7